jgi:hypothetical protein
MSPAHQAVESAVNELDRARKVLKKKRSKQIWSSDERLLLKATALAWFQNHKNQVVRFVSESHLVYVDQKYDALLAGSDRSASRVGVDQICKEIRGVLLQMRSEVLRSPTPHASADLPPVFSPLITDLPMQEILRRRWNECTICIVHDAPLSATVMMGGLLEALLLARVNRETDKSKIFKASVAPKDKTTGTVLQLKEWTLKNFLDVAHEIGWITRSAKDVGEVLRDYRNYIHPNKELSHGVNLQPQDASMFWEISKAMCRQILASV